MKRKFGCIIMVLGLAMLIGSLTLYLSNRHEEAQADHAAQNKLQQLVVQIEEKKEELNQNPTEPIQNILPDLPELETEATEATMPQMEIDGDGYIGFLSIPSLALELPVMADWSYDKLQISPCRFTGTLYDDNMVIMAHNYDRHFGQIPKLSPGDQVLFTDVNGSTTSYVVILQEVLQPDEVEEMTAGEFDLTLFTCTYGGGSRITIRCNRGEP